MTRLERILRFPLRLIRHRHDPEIPKELVICLWDPNEVAMFPCRICGTGVPQHIGHVLLEQMRRAARSDVTENISF